MTHLKMEMTARRHPTLTYLTNLLPHLNMLPRLDVNRRKMRVQSEKVIFMLDHNHIAIKIYPWTVNRFLICTREDHHPICSGVDRCAKLVQEFHTMMRIPRTPGC